MSATVFLESSHYTNPDLRQAHGYLLPTLLELIGNLPRGSRILDIGCGNGSVAAELCRRGYSLVGVDIAKPGIELARKSCPAARFEALPADRDILESLQEEPFDLVYSMEVIEHLYDPRSYMAGCYAATKRGGRFICTTPYHGYAKNLALAVANAWDKHADPLFDGGHIKLFSRKKLNALLLESGFNPDQFRGSGRLPYLWKSMVIQAVKA